MITINGRPDTKEIAHSMVIKILNESLVKYHGTRLGNDEVKALTDTLEKELEEIIQYVEKKAAAEYERRSRLESNN